MGANTKFGVKEVMNVFLVDKSTKKPVIYFDTLKTSEISVESETVYATGGRGNAKLIAWNISKDGTVTFSDALLSPKSLGLVSGIAPTTGASKVYMRQATDWNTSGDIPTDKGSLFPLTATSAGAITLAYTPNEVVADILVYEANDDCGTPLSMTGATLTGKTLTVAAASNKKVVVYYTFQGGANTEVYTIDASKFAGTYQMIGDTILRNRDTGKDEPFQIVIDNLKWSSNLNLSMSADGDPQPTEFTCDILRASDSDNMITMTRWV